MWTVETLNAVVDAEIQALPKDLRPRLIYISALIQATGLEPLKELATARERAKELE